MGRTARRKPMLLGKKLLYIRQALGLSQNQLIRRLGFEELVQGTISAFESSTREPSLLVLLMYARVANVSVESLIDDELYLPEKLPATNKTELGKKKVGTKTKAKRIIKPSQ